MCTIRYTKIVFCASINTAFSENPSSRSANKGADINISCIYPLGGNHVQSISWITPLDVITPNIVQESESTKSTLMLTEVDISDAGYYICVADVNGIEVNSTAAVLTVICKFV